MARYMESKTCTVFVSPTAHEKMNTLVQAFASEVAWDGCAKRVDTEDGSPAYEIEDIMVYPQTVSASRVDSDLYEYYAWIANNLEAGDERFKSMFFQGHSHVNMDTFFSGEDLSNQRDRVAELGDDGFCIFFVLNKKGERKAIVYDKRDNVIYEDGEVAVVIDGVVDDLCQFLADARAIVKTKPVQTALSTITAKKEDKEAKQDKTSVSPDGSEKSGNRKPSGKNKKTVKLSNSALDYEYDDDDDDIDMFYNGYYNSHGFTDYRGDYYDWGY